MIHKLPDLVIQMILFEYLSYEDVFNLQLVCKKLNQFKNFSKLNLFVHNYPFNDHLFYTNRLINHSCSFRTKSLEILKSVDFMCKFNKIQQLSINCSTNFYKLVLDDLTCLNRFQNLVHLQIKSVKTINGEISLPNLRICSVHTLNHSNLKINCSKLKALQIAEEIKVELIGDSNKLNHLSIRWVNGRDDDYLVELCSRLNQLSTLNVKSMRNLMPMLDKLDSNEIRLPSLNKIQLDCWHLKDLSNLITKLAVLNRNSSTKDVKFAINNRLIKINELIEIHNLLLKHNLNKDISKLTNNHLNYLAENSSFDYFLPSITELEIDEHIKLNENLICKLKNVNDLKIKNKLDDKLLELMIKNYNKLTYLYLAKASNLKSEQINLMSICLLNLKYLTIEKKLNTNEFKLIKFKNLKEITVKFKLNKREQILLFDNCPSLEEISISTGNETKIIKRATVNRHIYSILAFFLVFLLETLVCVLVANSAFLK